MTLFIIMSYRQKLYHEYCQQFLTLLREWNIDVQRAKEEGEKLAVGIRLSFIINLL